MATLPDASDSSSPDTLYKQIISLSHSRNTEDVGCDYGTFLSDILHANQSHLAAVCARARQQTLQHCIHLPDQPDLPRASSNSVCRSSVALMRCCQPALLQGWTPVDVIGDGNTYEPGNDAVY